MTTLIIGLSIGMLLLLLASGLTLIFGMLGILNFAHGAVFMLGAYFSWQLTKWIGDFIPALILVPLLAAGIGAVIERVLMRPLHSRPHVHQLLMTFALILVIEEAVRLTWGLDYKHLSPPAWLAGSVDIGGSQVAAYRLFVIAIGACVALALFLAIERTQAGMVMRACSSNPDMAQCIGIRIDRVRMLTFATGCALAALGGAMSGPMHPIQLGMGFTIILDCFLVVIVGGLGNIRGTVVVALVLGQMRAFGQHIAPEWADIAIYLVMLSLFTLRPAGLFGTLERKS